ncbi:MULTISPECIES: methyl-accepting chemotaxis protein [Haloferax]|uniref:methyl-accepting chemotaxis protein n=1 Tax=Haloferax TaxID=2251 RepID=UPI001786E0AF|nr:MULTISPECIES: methyl-accepting chemotaxis protein [Haloferax]
MGRTTTYQVPTEVVAAAAGGIVVSGVLGGLMVRSTMKSVDSISSSTETMRDGNLDVEVENGRIDAVGRLSESIAGFRDAVAERLEQTNSDHEQLETELRKVEGVADHYSGELEAALDDPSLRVDTNAPNEAMAALARATNDVLDAREDRVDELADVREQVDALHAERDRLDTENQQLKAMAGEYAEVLKACADGDLSQRMDEDVENEVASRFAAQFNEMMTEFEQTTVKAENFAKEVATLSNEVTVSATEVREGSEQVSGSLHSISNVAETQYDNLESVAIDMSNLSATIEEIDDSSSDVAEIAQQTVETGREGREAATEAIKGMKEIEQESVDTVEEIERLESEVQQIDDLIDFIREIAEQTNMLALNANIEASRAGESGQGFAVVAREIKELAEGTKDAAADIETRLEEIQSQTSQTVAEVRDTREQIARHTDSVQNAAEALNQIAENAQETNTGVQEISSVTSQQADATQAVLSAVDDATETSAETVEEASAAATGAEQQTLALSAVSDSASALATQANRLNDTLDQFKTEMAVTVPADEDAGEADEADPLESDEDVGEADEAEDVLADADGDDPLAEDPLAETPASDESTFRFDGEPGDEIDFDEVESDVELADEAEGEPSDETEESPVDNTAER